MKNSWKFWDTWVDIFPVSNYEDAEKVCSILDSQEEAKEASTRGSQQICP